MDRRKRTLNLGLSTDMGCKIACFDSAETLLLPSNSIQSKKKQKQEQKLGVSKKAVLAIKEDRTRNEEAEKNANALLRVHPPAQPRVPFGVVVRLQQPRFVFSANDAGESALPRSRFLVCGCEEEPFGLCSWGYGVHVFVMRRRSDGLVLVLV